jgi:hypothetical protein
MEMSTEKSAVECTVFPRQASLPRNSSSNNYSKQDTPKAYWKHKWRSISFTFVVDNFGVKYIGKEHVLHLIKVLKEHYKVEEDWGGTRYLGITLDWDYTRHEVHLSMLEYVE